MQDKILSYEISNMVCNEVPEPLVSVRTSTYNHAKYITKCIEGVLSQKTTFKFEYIIGEDYSTDGTRDIVFDYARKYPNLIRVITADSNVGMRANSRRCSKASRGKYRAVCEGDDYWTDPYKLQKQVDFLEANPDHGMVHTELDHYYVKTGKYVKNHWKTNGIIKQSGDLYEDILLGRGGMIYACTACYRADALQGISGLNFSKYMYGDIPTWLYIASKSKIGYIDESMAVRNVLPYSATQGRDFDYYYKFLQTSDLIFEDFREIRPVSKEIEHEFYQNYHARACELCYRFRKRFDLFEEHYAKLESRSRTATLKLKRILFKRRVPVAASRALLYPLRYLRPRGKSHP